MSKIHLEDKTIDQLMTKRKIFLLVGAFDCIVGLLTIAGAIYLYYKTYYIVMPIIFSVIGSMCVLAGYSCLDSCERIAILIYLKKKEVGL